VIRPARGASIVSIVLSRLGALAARPRERREFRVPLRAGADKEEKQQTDIQALFSPLLSPKSREYFTPNA
jgi:hypothetical protein